MTISKCLKHLPKLALVIAATLVSTGTLADTSSNLNLQDGDQVNVTCPQAFVPTLNDNALQCVRTVCKIEIVDQNDYCDIGGCNTSVVRFTVTLVGGQTRKVLFDKTIDNADKYEQLGQLRKEFAGSCGSFR